MTNNYTFPATLLCDFYKVSHKGAYPVGTETIYSTFTPRSNKYFPATDKVVAFGIQGFIKKYLVDYFNENFFNRSKSDVVNEYKRVLKFTLGVENPDASHIEELHDLGHLPIHIKSVKEGTLVPMKVPMLTIENTNKKFFWLTNYLETLMSTEIWQPTTSATIALEYRKILDEYAMKTTGSTEGVQFQGHDFSMRGMSSLETASTSGAGHLLSFTGTDTIPAILYHEKYYNANIEKELVGTSIPATEHSVQSSHGRDEYETFKYLITEAFPTGFVSIVSDTYDFWSVIEDVIPRLKQTILEREGKVVIRPDSGIPEDIICGKRFEKYENIEQAIAYLGDEIWDEATEACNGRHTMGDSEYVKFYTVGDKYYKAKFSVDYDRHDKTYYYVYDTQLVSNEEFIPSIEDLGLIEALWNIFGGTITEQGYKVLNPKIGAIYGDSITIARCKEICIRLREKGFASTNLVYGIGSYTYAYNTRDTFGFAVKATYAEINGEEKLIYKDPKTDDGTKKSQRGRVVVLNTNADGIPYFYDGLNKQQQEEYASLDMLEDVFVNGKLVRDQSLSEIRELLASQL